MTERPPPGPVADEAAKLVEVALGWARRAAAGYGGPPAGSDSDEPADPSAHVDGGTCRACPLCRASAALRDPSPEVGERLTAAVTDAAVALAEVLRVLSDAGVGGPRGGARPGPGDDAARTTGDTAEGGDAAPTDRPERVERIEIEDG